MAAPLAAILLLTGVYYAARLAPRVAQRVAMSQGGTAASAFSAHQTYRRYESSFEGVMSEREALLLLGFTERVAGATLIRPSEQEVKEHYYRLIKQLHSDVDGSPFVAAKLNEARDLLTKR